MKNLGELLRELRGNRSLRDVAEVTQLSHTYISDIEKGYRRGTKNPINPSPDTLRRLAKAYNYSYPKLMKIAGYAPEDQTADENEKDVAKRMEQLKSDLKNSDGLNFSGEPMSDEAIESLLEAMEYAVRQTQRINKKYIPKKHRK